MTIESNSIGTRYQRESQDPSASRIDRQCTDLRNRMHNVTVALLDQVCAHYHLPVANGASAEEKRQAIEEYFINPAKPWYRGRILTLLNRDEELVRKRSARYSRGR
ncbi:MAG: hypothetical protein V1876_00520 [Candidatus Peregrinibacteria bacterium]